MSETNETIELPLSEQDQVDLDKLAGPEVGDEDEKPPYHTVLEVWREVLRPSAAEAVKPPSMKWATSMIGMYPDLRFSDITALRDDYFAKIEVLKGILRDELSLDPECLTAQTPEQDLEMNFAHYKQLVFDWQLQFVDWEREWSSDDPLAAVKVAGMSETHKMFFGETGLLPYLESIKLQFTDEDQAELAEALIQRQTQEEASGE